MNLKDMKIDMRTFYKMGIFCFLIVGVMNSYSLYFNWNNLLWSGIVSAIFGIIFNFCLVLLFNYFLQQLPPITEEEKLVAEEDLNDLMESLK